MNTPRLRTLPPSTPMSHLSIEEFQALTEEIMERKLRELRPKRIVKGLREVADALHISIKGAWELKSREKFADCFQQEGRTILCDLDLLLERYGDKRELNRCNKRGRALAKRSIS